MTIKWPQSYLIIKFQTVINCKKNHKTNLILKYNRYKLNKNFQKITKNKKIRYQK